jgi:hypothetical protein
MYAKTFWPLRSFSDLHDVNRQARQWLEEVANQRLHRETRQRPVDRFQPHALRTVPALNPDYRDSVEALVHKDIRLHFDGNRYCVPPHLVGQRLMVKADLSAVTIYHLSSPQRDRFLSALLETRPNHRRRTFREGTARLAPGAACSQAQRRLILFLEPFISRETVESYLRGLTDGDRSLSRQLMSC